MSNSDPNNSTQTKRRSSFAQVSAACVSETIDAASCSSILCKTRMIIDSFISGFCCRVIFGPAAFKILVAFAIIIIGSILNTLELKPYSYLSSKKNIFNLYFVKVGWGWTLGLLLPFAGLTLMRNKNNYGTVIRHLIRLVIATLIWYTVTSLFVWIESWTGACGKNQTMQLSKRACLKAGYKWHLGQDISGHTFLLLYSILVINQEIKLYNTENKRDHRKSTVEKSENNEFSTFYDENPKLFDITIRILYILLAVLTILWEIMLLSTALFFHETMHKVIAGAIAVFFWYITYCMWYTSQGVSFWRPLKPSSH